MNEGQGVQALEALADRDPEAFARRLTACCGSRRWVRGMVARSPFGSEEELLEAAEEVGEALEAKDWLEAFRHHPRIGDVESLRARFGVRAGDWSSGEQAGVEGADDELLARLAEVNARYEERFGYLFVVCASGKGAAEMLELLEERLGNEPETELAIASREQRKITRLRLVKLLRDEGS